MQTVVVLVIIVILAAVGAGVTVAVLALVRRRQRPTPAPKPSGGGVPAGRRERRARPVVVVLDEESAARYRDDWNQIQLLFVEDAGRAVERADGLVVRIMRERGYPVDDFEQHVDELSPRYPKVVQHYRDAHAIAMAQVRGEADREQLRLAVQSYRALVDALLDHRDDPAAPRAEGPQDMQEL
jgi:hypothetical protein